MKRYFRQGGGATTTTAVTAHDASRKNYQDSTMNNNITTDFTNSNMIAEFSINRMNQTNNILNARSPTSIDNKLKKQNLNRTV